MNILEAPVATVLSAQQYPVSYLQAFTRGICAAEYMEKVYSSTSIIEDVCSMLVAVITPHKDNTQKWAMLNGIKGSFSELCALKELNDYILQELKLAAGRDKLRGFEHIRGIVIDPAPFDIEKDLVTATMKKKRLEMLKYYQVEIEQVYKNLAKIKK